MGKIARRPEQMTGAEHVPGSSRLFSCQRSAGRKYHMVISGSRFVIA
jgi:hypothetical protein